ncbi:unnamed protein product [Haemonchus placei]|uniref:Uncharacterized protein n=1 Tax=Haemonchus placei TaxID=6290 RepID=A0A3P7Z8T0_HAEPC|nr:unnamed protein product [Haemonchus placei]
MFRCWNIGESIFPITGKVVGKKHEIANEFTTIVRIHSDMLRSVNVTIIVRCIHSGT